MGKWVPGLHLQESDIGKRAELLLADCIKAKYDHRGSNMCEFVEGGSPDHRCPGCHFWSGSIHALEELLVND